MTGDAVNQVGAEGAEGDERGDLCKCRALAQPRVISSAGIGTDESLAAFQTMRLCFVEEEGAESGGTKLVDDGPEVRVAVSADRQRFERVFLDTLNGT
jgi:hypothetical protein